MVSVIIALFNFNAAILRFIFLSRIFGKITINWEGKQRPLFEQNNRISAKHWSKIDGISIKVIKKL